MRKVFLLLSIFSSCISALGQHALDPNFGNKGIVRTYFPPTENYTYNLCQQVIPNTDGSFFLVLNLYDKIILNHRFANGGIDLNYGENGYSVPVGVYAGVAALLPNGKMVIGSTLSSNDGGDFLLVCVSANGTLDKTFGNQGKQVINFSGRDHLSTIVISPDGKIVAAGYYDNGSGGAVARLNADGTLDNSFSGDGKIASVDMPQGNALAVSNTRIIVAAGSVAALLPNGEPDYSFGINGIKAFNSPHYIARVAIQPDGKIVLADQTTLMRLNTNGTFDNSFSLDGILTVDPGLMATVQDFAIDQQGRMLVVGIRHASKPMKLEVSVVACFTSNGLLDGSFSEDGETTIELDFPYTHAYSIAIQADARILIAGISTAGGSGLQYFAARFNTNGIPDHSFDSDGILIDYMNVGLTEFYASAVQPDGKIVCAGSARTTPYTFDFVIARFNADGSLDSSFSQDGFVTVFFTPGPYNTNMFSSSARALAIQPNGKIVVAGYSLNDLNTNYALVRLNSDGSMDNTFSEDGKLTTDLFGGNDYAYSAAIQSDGKIVAAGSSTHPEDPANMDFSLVRYNADGSLDNTFSWDGKQTTEFFSRTDQVAKVLIQPDGKILVVGEAGIREEVWSTNKDFGLARYRADGYPDNSFGYDGAIRIDFQGQSETASDAALLPDGTFLVSGTSEGHFAVTKLRANGFLDSSFADNGKKVVELGYQNEICSALAIQTNGRIILGGTVTNGVPYQESDIAIVGLFSNGSIDTSLSWKGSADMELVAQPRSVESINIHNGHLYAAGSGWYIDKVGIILSMKLECNFGVSIPDAWAIPVCTDPNTVYKGYAPAESLSLTAVTNGTAPFNYLWNTGGTTKTIRVKPNVTTKYSVTVIDAYGCSQQSSRTVNVVDVRCGHNGEKVLVCQIQHGKWESRKTVCVDAWSATVLLLKGARLGSCSSDNLSSPTYSSQIEEKSVFELTASPNPSNHQFSVNVKINDKQKAELIITDAQGRTVERRWIYSSSIIKVGDKYAPGIYVAELKQGERKLVIKLVKTSQ